MRLVLAVVVTLLSMQDYIYYNLRIIGLNYKIKNDIVLWFRTVYEFMIFSNLVGNISMPASA